MLDLERAETWAGLVQASVSDYFRRAPSRCRMVELFRRDQELTELCFENHRRHLLACFDSDYGRQTTDRQIVLGYMARDPSHRQALESLEELSPPWWKQKFLLAQYGDPPRICDLKSRTDLSAFFDRITDLEVMEHNLNPYGGGRGRTPLGTFTEAVLSHYKQHCESSRATSLDQYLHQLMELFYSLQALRTTIAKFRQQLDMPPCVPVSSRILFPSQVRQGLLALGDSFSSSCEVPAGRPRSSSEPRRPVTADEEPEPQSPSAISHVRFMLQRSVWVICRSLDEVLGWGSKYQQSLEDVQPSLKPLAQATQLAALELAGVSLSLELDALDDESLYRQRSEELEAMWRLRELQLNLELACLKIKQ